MNVVFWLLVVCALILTWFLLAFAFRGIGWFAYKLFNDAVEEINKED